MFSKTWIFILLFLTASVFFGIKTHEIWSKKDDRAFSAGDVHVEKPKYRKRDLKKRKVPESYYRAVVDKNLFSPDRSEHVLKEEKSAVRKKARPAPPGKRIVLMGVFIAGEYKKALVRWFDVRESAWKTEGESIGEMRLVSINERSVTLSKAGKMYEVRMYDKKEKKRSGRRKAGSSLPEVVTIESGRKTPPPEKDSKTDRASGETEKRKKTPFVMPLPGKELND